VAEEKKAEVKETFVFKITDSLSSSDDSDPEESDN
jgi:DNA polymerase kappa